MVPGAGPQSRGSGAVRLGLDLGEQGSRLAIEEWGRHPQREPWRPRGDVAVTDGLPAQRLIEVERSIKGLGRPGQEWPDQDRDDPERLGQVREDGAAGLAV